MLRQGDAHRGGGLRKGRATRLKVLRWAVGLDTNVKPLLSHSTAGEFNSPPKYLRIPRVRVEPYWAAGRNTTRGSSPGGLDLFIPWQRDCHHSHCIRKKGAKCHDGNPEMQAVSTQVCRCVGALAEEEEVRTEDLVFSQASRGSLEGVYRGS
eukprot:1175975-Prorocentrum_minimum.AAC.1